MMSSLSVALRAVLDQLPAHLKTAESRKKVLHIHENSAQLDSLGKHPANITEFDRAARTSKASSILFGNRAVLPNSSSYRDAKEVNWSRASWLAAACYIEAEDATDVALAIKLITHFGPKFAVRGAGHNANPGFAGTDETGVVIDLRSLHDISLSPEKNVVSVGPAATWDSVYGFLEQHQLGCVGGRVKGVGVAGLLLGGGMSHFSNRWGMVCDSVKSFQVVLADSTIVHVDAHMNQDLFQALKGGGANFGIVTSFDLYTMPDFKLRYTVRVYSTDKVKALSEATVEIEKEMENDTRIGFFFSLNAGFLVAGLLYVGHATFPKVFQPILDMEAMAVPTPETCSTLLSATQALSMDGKDKRAVAGITVYRDPELYVRFHSALKDITEGLPCSIQASLQPLGSSAVEKGRQLGGNSMGIPDESQCWIAIDCKWTEDKHDELGRRKTRELVTSLESIAKSQGLLSNYQFMNDASHLQSPLSTFGAESIERLRAASRKYDGKGVFQRLQYGGFLLSKLDADGMALSNGVARAV